MIGSIVLRYSSTSRIGRLYENSPSSRQRFFPDCFIPDLFHYPSSASGSRPTSLFIGHAFRSNRSPTKGRVHLLLWAQVRDATRRPLPPSLFAQFHSLDRHQRSVGGWALWFLSPRGQISTLVRPLRPLFSWPAATPLNSGRVQIAYLPTSMASAFCSPDVPARRKGKGGCQRLNVLSRSFGRR